MDMRAGEEDVDKRFWFFTTNCALIIYVQDYLG